jgi:CTP:molybdopterin cytidylyltransferase MocA
MTKPVLCYTYGPAYAVLLAAGAGARFGGDKLLAPLHGRPLISHVAATLAEAIAEGVLAGGVAVVPVGATALADAIDPAGLTLVESPDPAAGMSSSLKLGVTAVFEICRRHEAANSEFLHRPNRPGILIVLADQPNLRLDVIKQLIAEWRRTGHTARPRYLDSPDVPGHPVLLDRRLWNVALYQEGDAGLRDYLNTERVQIVDVEGLNPDIDTAQDLADLEG